MTGEKNMPNGEATLDYLLEVADMSFSFLVERYPGRKFFGYFCSYWPEELVLAAGMEPVRLLPGSIQAVPAALPAYCCSLARGCLAAAEKGDFSGLTGTGFAHTCDTMQCLGGIWQEVAGRDNTLHCVPPVTLDSPGAGTYYLSELKNTLENLERLAGRRTSSGDLQRALELCRRTRRLVDELDAMRPSLPSPLVSALLRAGQVMPREEFAAALEEVMPVIRSKTPDAGNRCRVLVSGAVLENDSLFGMVEELGGRVVADDTCTGYRHYWDSEGGNLVDPENALESIRRRYVDLPPCPCRTRGLDYRAEYLTRLAAERKAAVALLVIRKYCEPHAWDAVPVAERLRQTGVKTMVLELEGAEVGGQERTRLQAFLESTI